LFVFRKRVRACVRSRAGVFVFRPHVRAAVCSRAGDFARRKILRCRRGGSDAERLQNFSCPKPEGLRQGRLAAARKRAPAEPWPQGHWRERDNRGTAKRSRIPQDQRFAKSRNSGPLNLAPLFLCIGAQSSSPHECVCHPSVLSVPMGRTALLGPAGPRAVLQTRSAAFSYCCPTRSKHVVQYARIPPGDGAGWPGGSVVEGSDTPSTSALLR
jgi:hypothetical protein